MLSMQMSTTSLSSSAPVSYTHLDVYKRQQLTIRDHGAGFPTTRAAPRLGNSGVGLQLARRAVERVHGTLHTSPVGHIGGEVRIELPLTQ